MRFMTTKHALTYIDGIHSAGVSRIPDARVQYPERIF